jgi:micrococcal nuclease
MGFIIKSFKWQLNLIFIVLCFSIQCTKHKDENLENKEYYFISKVVDGDTYHILLSDNSKLKIRMEGIDAPEKGMPFYKESKQFLIKMTSNKKIRFVQSSKDQYGRIIAKTYSENNQELGEEMVKNGMAWHFKKYSKDTNLAQLEISAKNKHLGLWEAVNPQAPWEYRKLKRQNLK